MVCQSCGAEVNADAFCSKCGTQMPAQAQPAYPPFPPAAYVSRVQQHVQPLGILWCVYGVYRLVTAGIGFFVLRTFAWHQFGFDWPFHHAGAAPWFVGLLPLMIAMTVVASGLALLTGYALVTRKPWGRVLAIVVGILALLKIPFGTALGIYTLWVLASGVSGMEYDAIADRS